MNNENLKLQALEQKIEYFFKDKSLLTQALTHRSLSGVNYERLEFVGDSILDHVIALSLYCNYPYLAEGDLSKIRAFLVNQEALAEIAKRIELNKYLCLGDGEERSGGRNRDSILADSLEAIFAAISLDSDFFCAKAVIEKLFRDKIANAKEFLNSDSKTELQEYVQARKLSLPQYTVVAILGPDHDSIFKIECMINDLNIKVVASGKSKKEASQNAASAVLKRLKSKYDKD